MRRARAAVAASVVLVLLTVVVASAADARSEKATVTTVTLSGWSAGKTEDDLLQSVVDDFNNTHPNIHVDYSVIKGDYPTAMTARFAAHNPPDVFYVDSSTFRSGSSRACSSRLNSYIKKSKYDTSKFIPGLLNAFKVREDVSTASRRTGRRSPMEINTSMLAQGGDQEVPTDLGQLPLDAQKMASSNAVPNGKPICLPPTGRGCCRSSSRTRARSRKSSRRRLQQR